MSSRHRDYRQRAPTTMEFPSKTTTPQTAANPAPSKPLWHSMEATALGGGVLLLGF